MSYEVDTLKEVKQKLEELGVDSVSDVRRAGGAYRRDIPAVIQAEQLHLSAHASPGSMTASPDELVRIGRYISMVRDEIHALIAEVRLLSGHQFDGWGPIAERMAACVSARTGPDTGAERALTSYLAELADLEAVLTQTAVLYASLEQESVEQLRKAAHTDG
ncbi:MAG TPA: hypothetical protein VGX25_06380 [Actinophytocola sp.]|uniref:hypothetical protein n=1 Tax=Actinophytocola sp. TaxID=1872138 RepID=UPI002DDDB902|nr:hypothetical protein [Actinophytocola sp.]HEV2779013.1 hypothetical protein [Actinophytocola sp.]